VDRLAIARAVRGVLILLLVGACGRSAARYPALSPAGSWRAFHCLNYNTDSDLVELAGEIPALVDRGINTLILEVDYHFQFRSHPELRQGEEQITRAGARRFTRLCRQYGIRLIPEFQCVGHQSWAEDTFTLLTVYPEFDLTPGEFPGNEGLYCREWDVLNPAINEIIFALLDELIDAFDAEAFHVGMDEVFLLGSEFSPSTSGHDPAELFAKAVNDIHGHLVGRRGVEMLMWGDRLIDAALIDYGEWEASAYGTAPAVDMIPNDIIICDWHYELREDYPSIPMFKSKGFRVLPTSFRQVEAVEALIRSSLRHSGDLMLGHLFTVWGRADKPADYSPLVAGMEILDAR